MKPSVRAIIWNDWPALACALGIPVVWVIFTAFPVLKRLDPSEVSFYVALATVISATLAVILIWRAKRIFNLFAHGTEVAGQITWVQIVRDRGRLEFQFEMNGKPMNGWTAVHKSKRVMSLAIGQPVRVLVQPSTSTAIVKDLYV
ncbi:hypothetical protein [Niveibacterium microcysteis]|uniref:DUF3592 domain-containing protein n=1 Tax=Niveibacterium microcysteis TaxID=2811415 RepID=A0ABX7M7N4_9RHOO|nr:hypothetical protein [Niveibacterium microcysteis]QSI76654.1 hypothetical protein JY500_19685 [Niveibacterium microcysteis]